ncbi:MAG: monovalent cation/H(+) antiporter subunit G [Pseudonocardia sp.]|nr:monovalent cation/H(+) antiporter subunit G [Pseudonocardia sp.]
MTDILSAALLLAGAAQCLLGALGLVRLPSVLSRLQAATKPLTLGLFLILAGAALRVPPDSAVTLLLVAAFQLITAPVIGQLVGRSAYNGGSVQPRLLVVDELAPRMPREGPERPPAGP